MNDMSSSPDFVSQRYLRTHQDPIKHADEIIGVWVMRHSSVGPADPLGIAIDQSAIDHMGWQPGDAVTLVPRPAEGPGGEGKLIIRRGRPGEVAFILGEPPDLSKANCEWSTIAEMHGPHFEWAFDIPWVEAFFPGDYDPETHDFNSQTERSWPLGAILGQEGQIELPLGPEELFLYLQRTSPGPTALDVHLIPGLMARRGWSPRTPLVLESESGFDPFAAEDVLSIREHSLGE